MNGLVQKLQQRLGWASQPCSSACLAAINAGGGSMCGSLGRRRQQGALRGLQRRRCVSRMKRRAWLNIIVLQGWM